MLEMKDKKLSKPFWVNSIFDTFSKMSEMINCLNLTILYKLYELILLRSLLLEE